MKNIIFLPLMMTASLGTAYAAPDLMNVFQQALKNDQTFKSARAQYLSATEADPQARAVLLPAINATASLGYLSNDIVSGATPGTSSMNTYSYTLNVDQPVINFGKWATVQQAGYSVKQAAAQYSSAAQDLISRVAQAYLNVLEAEDTLRFTEAEKRATERQLDQAQQRYKVGLDAITSVYDAQASYDAIVADEIAAKNNVVNSKEQLREITGIYYDNIAKLKKAMPLLTPEPNRVEAWVDKATSYNFSLQAARFAMEAARENIKIQYAGHLPTLDVVASYNRTKKGTPQIIGAQDTKTGTAGLQLSVPIFQGGLVTSQVRQAQYDYDNAVAQMEQTYRQVSVELRQTYNSIIAGISKIKADKQTIKSRQASLESTEAALKVGTRTMVDLLQAQQQLFQAQTTLAQDQYAYINNTLSFKQLAGTLTLNDLKAINSWLQGNDNAKPPYNLYRSQVDTEKLNLSRHDNYHVTHTAILQSKQPQPDKQTVKKANKAQKSSTNADAYTIQLLADHDKQTIENFIRKQQLGSEANIYQTQNKGQTWYVLAYGNYHAPAQANAALKQLPASLKQLKPWVRRLPSQ